MKWLFNEWWEKPPSILGKIVIFIFLMVMLYFSAGVLFGCN